VLGKTAVAVRLEYQDLLLVLAADPGLVDGTVQLPDRHRQAGAGIDRAAVLLRASLNGADGLKIGPGEYSYTDSQLSGPGTSRRLIDASYQS
jgi:hypothetical protein